MGTLTVRENLRFSAALRLPTSVPQSEKEARVNRLILELGLTRVADSKVNINTCLFFTLLCSLFQSSRLVDCKGWLAHGGFSSQVGTQMSRGISGGERKRTNIGMELIIDPSVLFLDEPTTGLDASTAHSVLLLLKRY